MKIGNCNFAFFLDDFKLFYKDVSFYYDIFVLKLNLSIGSDGIVTVHKSDFSGFKSFHLQHYRAGGVHTADMDSLGNIVSVR